MELKAGQKLWSTVCDTQVVVVRAPQGDVDLRCGGSPMGLADGERRGEPSPDLSGGTSLGKRYADEAASLELLSRGPAPALSRWGGRPSSRSRPSPSPRRTSE